MFPRTAVLALAASLAAAALAPAPAHAQDDWEVRRNPFDPRLVARYKAALEKNPDDAAVRKRLVSLYARHASTTKLVGEYEREAGEKPQVFAYPMILGHLLRERGDAEAALGWYDKAAALRPADPGVNLARAELYRRLRRGSEAMAALDKALPGARSKAERKQILSALASIALDAKDVDRAQGYYRQLLQLEPGDTQTRLDLADALARFERHEDALKEYRALADALRSDPARRVEVLARVGRALEALDKSDDAVAVYRQAMDLTQKGHYLRKELTERIIEIYRKRQDVRSLIAFYEKAWPLAARGHFEWSVLGRLYESTGEQDQAVDAYRKAVAASPAELETQRRLIALLEISGQDDEALKRYDALIRIAPGEPRFQLELAERYFRRGDKKRALALAEQVSRRFTDDGGVHAALADLFSRWGEDKLALREYETLVRVEPEDPSNLVNLGEQHFQRGDKPKAVEIWKRVANSKTAETFARLAEVYSEHDMGAEAVEAYAKALGLKPNDPALHRGFAGVLERHRQDDRAIEEWEKYLELTKRDPAQKPQRREARTRIVAILARRPGNALASVVRQWQKRFDRDPPDIEAGAFLAEGHLKLGNLDSAERTLKRLLALDAGDVEAMQQLVGVYKGLRRYEDAIALLKRMVPLQPGREHELYTQISDLELVLYHDDEAIAYAEKALAKSPNDPTAQVRLAEIYEKRQDYPRAALAYQHAVGLAPRDFPVYFALARLEIRRGEPSRAARLYRDVIARATDEETIRKAARAAIDIEEYLGTLGELEQHVGQLAFLFTGKPIYRRITVEIYDRMVPPLVARARAGDAAATRELTRIGESGLKPLLEALADKSEPTGRRVAVAVLGELGNRGAAPPLIKLALEAPEPDPSGPASMVPMSVRGLGNDGVDLDLRLKALVAAGRLGDPHVIPFLVELSQHRDRAIRLAAIWALGNTRDPRAVAPVVAALSDVQPSVQAAACIAIGRLGDRRALGRAVEIVRDPRAPGDARAACAWALGVTPAAAPPGAVAALLEILAEGNDDVHRNAAWTLGRIGDRNALSALLKAYWTKKDSVRAATVWAIARTATGAPDPSPVPGEDLAIVEGAIDQRRLLRSLVPQLPTPTLAPSLLRGRGRELAEGIRDGLGRHRDVVVRILRDLDTQDDGLGLGVLTDGIQAASPTDRDAAIEVLTALETELQGDIVKLATHRDPGVRARAVALLGKLRTDSSTALLEQAIADEAPGVRAAAIGAVERYARQKGPRDASTTRLTAALAARLQAASWRDRLEAAVALGNLGAAAPTAALADVLDDPSAFVREAAAVALGRLGAGTAVPQLIAASTDEATEVRLAAVTALAASGDPRARARLAELARTDPDARVRAAARKP